MSARIIPIVPAALASQRGLPPVVNGDPGGLVQAALEAAVARALGLQPGRWLRELRVGADEAYVAVAPDLGREGVESAGIAFDTLRRLLPDTDIYVGAAQI